MTKNAIEKILKAEGSKSSKMKELYNVKSNVSQLLNIDEQYDMPTRAKSR